MTKRITENKLLRAYIGQSNGGMSMSTIDGEIVWWTYRLAPEFANHVCGCICASDDAALILIEEGPWDVPEHIDRAKRLTATERAIAQRIDAAGSAL